MSGVHLTRSSLSLAACALTLSAVATPAPAADFFVKPAGSGTACLQSVPCTLATALAAASAGDTVYVGAGSYYGTGEQVVLLDKTVNLLGGWDGAASGPIKRDHAAFSASINGQGARRAILITGLNTAPTLDGLSITGGNASGLTTNCGFEGLHNGCGGGIFIWHAHPTITNCNISGNRAATTALAPDQTAAGGGISVFYGDGTVIRENTFSSNIASTVTPGWGGAIAVEETACIIEGNRIIGNSATSAPSRNGWGGGIAIEGLAATVTLAHNLLNENTAAADAQSRGNALYTWYATVNASDNFFASSKTGDTLHVGYVHGSLTRNRMQATGGADSALMFFNGHGETVVVTNNVIIGGAEATVVAKGFVENPLDAVLAHNTIVGNGADTGLVTYDYTTLTLTNNIIAGHAIGVAVGAQVILNEDHTLFWNNDDDGIRGDDPVDGDPRFVNRAFGDFHVYAGSAAQGAGVDAGVATDIDGDARPGLGGFDIGADEVAPAWFDFGTPTSPVAAGYVRVTQSTAYSAAQGFGWKSGVIASRDRSAPDDLRRDFCFTPLGTFAVDVPNGRYRVTIGMGDRTNAHDQMGILLEGKQVASVTTAVNEFKVVTADVSVTDGQLTLLLDDLGGNDPNVVIGSLIVLRMPSIWLDLGTPSSPVAPGYTRVTPASLFSRESGGGWLGGIVQARDRGIGTALLRDFNFLHMGYYCLYLQDGVYNLSLTFGDATTAHDNMAVGLQAQGMGPGLSTAANQFVTRTYPANVVNNLLRIYLIDSGGKDPNLVLNAVEVRPRAQPRFDFGTPTSPVAEGYLQVTPATAYEAWRGYGWTAGALSSRDRGTADPLGRDFVFGTQLEFAVDVLDGVYDVVITMGDATNAHDQMALTLEGNLVDTVSTPAGPAASRTYRVWVTGGQLNLTLTDQGGSDVNAVINALEIR